MASDVLVWLKMKKKNVIGNFSVNEDIVKSGLFGRKKVGKFTYIPNSKMTVRSLVDYAEKHHERGVEKQTLLCIDECQTFFNPREYSRADRLEWNNFFSQHRKLGFEVILITQTDRLIDRQIRALIEYEVKHRKVNNFKFGKMSPVPLFCAVTYWYGVRERLGSQFFTYRKKLGNLYDSYKMFESSGGNAN